MRRVLPLFFLALSLPLFAQTGTFTANGYGACQDSSPVQQALYCTVSLNQNGVLQGYLTFYLVNNKTTTIIGGEVWRYNSLDQQTGYATDVTGTIDTANYIVQFQFSNTISGSATVGYKIIPGACTRYCRPPRVVITSGIVTFQ